MIHGTVRPLLLQQGPNKQQIWGDSHSSPQEEWRRTALQGSAGFGDSTWGCEPKIEKLGHRLGEHGVRPDTGERGVVRSKT